jgi:hypothetical protein
LSIISGPFSVAPCQTLISRFATFASLYPRAPAAAPRRWPSRAAAAARRAPPARHRRRRRTQPPLQPAQAMLRRSAAPAPHTPTTSAGPTQRLPTTSAGPTQRLSFPTPTRPGQWAAAASNELLSIYGNAAVWGRRSSATPRQRHTLSTVSRTRTSAASSAFCRACEALRCRKSATLVSASSVAFCAQQSAELITLRATRPSLVANASTLRCARPYTQCQHAASTLGPHTQRGLGAAWSWTQQSVGARGGPGEQLASFSRVSSCPSCSRFCSAAACSCVSSPTSASAV